MAFLQVVLALAYAGLVLYNVLVVNKASFDSLYTYHPIGVSLFLVFTVLGLASAQKIRGKAAATKQAREPYVQLHGLFNWLALFSLIAAQACIYLNKEKYGKPHLSTYHGILGASTAGFFAMNVFGGGAMNTVPSLYKYIKFHRLNGYLIFLAILGTQCSAVLNGYVAKGSDNMRYALLGLLGGIALVSLSKVSLALLPGGKGSKAA